MWNLLKVNKLMPENLSNRMDNLTISCLQHWNVFVFSAKSLNIVIGVVSPDKLKMYNKVFLFLVSVKRALWCIQSISLTQISRIDKQIVEEEQVRSVYIYKVVISVSVCLFIFPIITKEPLDRFVSYFDWGTRETHGNILSLVLRF